MAENEQEEKQPIIVKKVIKGGDGHHGGAWKVAYADFVTAMMAFFLLMWLLNVTTEAQKNAISAYFDPSHPRVAQSTSGSGGVLGGLSVSPTGTLSSTVSPFASPDVPSPPNNEAAGEEEEIGQIDAESYKEPSEFKEPTAEELELEELKKELEQRVKQEEQRFEQIKERIEQAIQESPDLKKLAKNLLIDITPEGLRIQLIDQQNATMFPSGSSQMFARTRKLLEEVTNAIIGLPNEVSIRGHTDAVPYRGRPNYTNWELSTDRANSSRRIMLGVGMPSSRINNVIGRADTDPLLKDDPRAPQNRRISIMLLREATVQGISLPSSSQGRGGSGGDQNNQTEDYLPQQNGVLDFGNF